MNIAISIVITLVIIFVVPVFVYGLFTKLTSLKEPDKKLGFFISVIVQKIGTSFGFVFLYAIGRNYFGSRWLLYGMIWAVMFAIVEVGQAIGPNYLKKEAVAGIISEFIYFPLSALVISKLLI